MNFYRAQQDARRKTMQLAALFIAAVLTLVVLTNLLVAVAYLWFSDFTTANVVLRTSLFDALSAIPVQTWLTVTAGVVGVISLACGYKYLIVRQGGRAIAESLGGVRVLQQTEDLRQRRLLNVVEEMALAAGVAVPPVYLIDEPSINAFAAGFGTDDAVIGVNQGTIDHLSREELQGVIAHEFSHIMNADTRINLRLIAMLHGILFIGLIGYMLLRSGGGRSSGGGRGSSAGAPILLLGIGFMAIGYGGTFFGNLIKSAVSRQREYLADGSAVQYTRNPQGISGALKKIGGLTSGSAMLHPNAKEASHMFFGEAVRTHFGSLMATHPPLDERIKAIEPRWDGKFPTMATLTEAFEAQNAAIAAGASGFAGAPTVPTADLDDEFDVLEQKVAKVNEVVGNPDDQSHENALLVLQTTHPVVREAAHNPWAASALAYALLLSPDTKVRDAQFQALLDRTDHGLAARSHELVAPLDELDDLHKLTLLHSAMPALKEMSRDQYRRFMGIVAELIKQDRQIDLFEWVLHRILVKELRPHYERPKPVKWRYRRAGDVAREAAVLLSSLAANGSNDQARNQRAFDAGLTALEIQGSYDPSEDPNFTRLNDALKRLRQLAPLAKPQLIKACAATVLADETVTVAEGAMLQGVAATLDCPLPPAIYDHIE